MRINRRGLRIHHITYVGHPFSVRALDLHPTLQYVRMHRGEPNNNRLCQTDLCATREACELREQCTMECPDYSENVRALCFERNAAQRKRTRQKPLDLTTVCPTPEHFR